MRDKPVWGSPELDGDPIPTFTPPHHVCTKDDPWTPEKYRRSVHPDAVYLHDRDDGDGETPALYRCPHCGRTFEEARPG